MKKCAYCGQENPDDATVCMIDQQPLAPEDKTPRSSKLSHEDVRAHMAARPRAVKLAVGLLAFSSFLDFVRLTVNYHSYLSRHLDFCFSMVFTYCFVSLLLYFVFRGKNWARWVLVCMLFLGSFSPFLSRQQFHWGFYFYMLFDIVVVAALFQRSANEWFAKPKKASGQLLPTA
jgi:hypothetical protein